MSVPDHSYEHYKIVGTNVPDSGPRGIRERHCADNVSVDVGHISVGQALELKRSSPTGPDHLLHVCGHASPGHCLRDPGQAA
jgi:hypothetical protein